MISRNNIHIVTSHRLNLSNCIQTRRLHIGILGGGITGISTAWHLEKALKAQNNVPVKITLIEGSERMGGWVHSTKRDGILLELGPRTLRPSGDSGQATLETVYTLGLTEGLLKVPKTSPAAQNRWIQFGDDLLALPNQTGKLAMDLLRKKNPIFNRSLVKTVLKEPRIPASQFHDESLYDFLLRRFPTSPGLAEILSTALCHGIWSGDARKLSLRSNFPSLWKLERLGKGSLIKGAWKQSRQKGETPSTLTKLPWHDTGMDEFVSSFKDTSVYTWKDGLEHLTKAMIQNLCNVEIVTGESITSIDFRDMVHVTTSKSTFNFNHVVSTLPANHFSKLLPQGRLQNYLKAIPFSSVALSALAFNAPPRKFLPVNGFGYLVPLNHQPNQPLGVVFDSCAAPGQDDGNITRLTVMVGGHSLVPPLSTSSPEEITSNALQILRNGPLMLPINLPNQWGTTKVLASQSMILHDCIPQYEVGHHNILRHIHHSLVSPPYRGRLSVAGASYQGVSVNDCLLSGREVALNLANRLDNLQEKPVTGLDKIHN